MTAKQLMQLIRSLQNTRTKNSISEAVDIHRRQVLKRGVLTASLIPVMPSLLTACGYVVKQEKVDKQFRTRSSNISSLGPLREADENGVRLPEGYSSRIIARTNEKPFKDSNYVWHWAPDGGDVFATRGGGWIYVSNSETAGGAGGAGALVFGVNGDLRDAYSILEGTSRNCSGGKTPWGTWLSCEEVSDGHVWECDPMGISKARRLDALGTFSHEAVAVDLVNNQFFLTEDEQDGRLYRFTPDGRDSKGNPDLTRGVLEVMQVLDQSNNNVVWHTVFDPNARKGATRYQVRESTAFDGGEGIVYLDGYIYMATKGDNRIWRYDVANQTMTVFYDAETHPNPILTGVDTLTAVPTGELFVAEDGGDLQLISILPNLELVPVLQVVDQPNSEITGPAINQHGNKLYFSSQRGTTGTSAGGITYEITGPFFVK
ncbi:alkaline phosphatase PhoX [Kaarinaea lacus]